MAQNDRVQELLAVMLEGRLDAAGQKELAATFEAHPEAAREALDLRLQDARAAYVLGEKGSVEENIADVMDAVRRRHPTSDGLVRRVMAGIREPQERLTPRRAARPVRRTSSVPWGVIIAAAAAGAVVVTAVVMTSWRPQARETAIRKASSPPVPPPEAPPSPKPEKKPAVARHPEPVADREKIEREMAEAVKREREGRQARAPQDAPRPAIKPVEPDAPAPEKRGTPTRIALAELGRPEGAVFVVDGNERSKAKEGQGLLARQGLEVEDGRIRVKFSDGTWLALGARTSVAEFSDEGGKRVALSRGALEAQVSKQAKPMVFSTPHGESTVLGTRLRLLVDTAATRLEVTEGKVKQTSLSARKSVDVHAGHFVVVGESVKLEAKPIPKMETVVLFDFEDGKLPADWSKGQIEAGPARAGNRFCLAVAEKIRGGGREALLAKKGPPLLTVGPDLEIRFDYWATGAARVWIYLWDETQNRSFLVELPRAQERRWNAASARLQDFRADEDRSAELKAGDAVRSMSFGGDFQGENALYIDNVELLQSRR